MTCMPNNKESLIAKDFKTIPQMFVHGYWLATELRCICACSSFWSTGVLLYMEQNFANFANWTAFMRIFAQNFTLPKRPTRRHGIL